MLQIEKNVLKAISFFQAKDDVRYYLNGIFIESDGKNTVLVATTGQIIAVYNLDIEIPKTAIIIPQEIIDTVIKWKIKSDSKTLTFDLEKKVISEDYRLPCGQSINFEPIDGKFPNWRSVIKDISQEINVCSFDPKLFEQFIKAAKILNTTFRLHIKGDSISVVQFDDCPDFFGGIMSKRVDNINPLIPDWLK